MFICFIDLKAAYDWINRDMLFKVLDIRIKFPILVNILKLFYTGTSAVIKGSKVFFSTFTGCCQGGLESPVLFNIYMDFVLRCAEHEVLQIFPIPDRSTLTEYQAIAQPESNVVFMA